MEKPLNESEISPKISPRPRKRPAAYLGVFLARAGGDKWRLRWRDTESGKWASEGLPQGLSAKERELRRRAGSAATSSGTRIDASTAR